jgi:hypothetical protein
LPTLAVQRVCGRSAHLTPRADGTMRVVANGTTAHLVVLRGATKSRLVTTRRTAARIDALSSQRGAVGLNRQSSDQIPTSIAKRCSLSLFAQA